MVRYKMIDDLIIKPMTVEDVPGVAVIEKEAFSVPWSENALFDELKRTDAHFFVAVINGEVCGYIGSYSVCGEVYITNVAVKSEHRRKGVALRLLNELISVSKGEKCEFITLEVRKSNENAKKLYESLGFTQVGSRKDFYDLPREDALIYTLYLIGDM